MIRDIIFALNGIGGEVLKKLLKEEIVGISIQIHPCEKKILEELISIADNFKTIQNFIRRVPQFGSEPISLDNGVEILPGMYLRAFCNGLYDSLEPYRRNLISLEREVLQDPHFSLSGILARVTSFVPLLSTLNSIINQIVARKIHGCKILQVLHENSSSGILMVDEALAKIIRRCHLVMLKQLTSWLLHGHLLDPHNEFFIEACMTTSDAMCSSMTTLDTESLPENLLHETSLPEYRIVMDMVPSYIPHSIPEKAKFIGSTVVLFSRDPRDRKSTVDMKVHDSVYKKMESSLLDQLKVMQNSDVLDVSVLESAINNVRSCVTQHLFTLAMDEADLLGELKLIKEFYLLGRGEMFVSFLRKACNILFKPVSTNSARDLNKLLAAAVQNTPLNSNVITEKFSFKVPPKDAVPSGSTVWSVMTLECTPPWPLHLLFTPPVLASYNTLFNFLLQVKIAELNLHDVWIDNNKRKDNPHPPEVWTLRNKLMFLVQNLQCYLQLDVLDSEFCTLRAALDKTHDFEQVIHHHSLFLTHITAQCFLLSKEEHRPDQPPVVQRHPVNKCIVHMLQLCDQFCAEVVKSEISQDNLKQITEDFDMKMKVLMDLLTVLGTRASGLRLLLLRLDYNRFFSEQAS